MGQSSAATVREIEDLRDRLEVEMRELERRLPQPAVWVKRLAGVAVGGGIGAIVVTRLVKRARARRQRGGEVDGRPTRAVIQVVPAEVGERLSAALEDGRWRQWAAAGIGVWLGVRLLELRQLRRLNRQLVASRI